MAPGSWQCSACLTTNPKGTRLCGACRVLRTYSPKVCVWCGKTYTKTSTESGPQWDSRVCCSRTCGGERRAELRRQFVRSQTKTCVVCGEDFSRRLRTSDKQWEARECCGKDCAYRLRPKRVAATRAKRTVQLKLPKVAKLQVEADGKRTCPKCSFRKPIAEFPLKGTHRHGDKRYGYCKPCASKYQRERKLENIFGLTVDDQQKINAFQDGKCAICLRPPSNRRLAIDHDHKTGLIRGELCWICNRLLGFVNDNAERLRRASEYLEHPPAVRALGREVYGRKGKTTNKAPRRTRKKAA